MSSLSCASIGYQQRRISEFCEALAAESVEMLVDVRAAAWSQRPEYRKQALKQALQSHGIDYIHCREAGNPYRPRKGHPLDVEACARLYAQHLDANPGIVERVAELISGRRAALFCYESHRDNCHRGIIFDALQDKLPMLRIVDL